MKNEFNLEYTITVSNLVRELRQMGLDAFEIRADALKNKKEHSKKIELVLLGGKLVVEYTYNANS